MATQLFLTDTVSVPNDFSTGTNTAKLDGTTSGWSLFQLQTTRGAAANFVQGSTVAGPTAGVETASTGANHWVSPPLDADVTIAGTITFNLWAAESSTSANVAINVYIDRIDSTGAVVSRVIKTARTTEVALTTRAVNNFTGTPTSTAFNKGDRIRIVPFGDDSTSNMATAFTFTVGHSATSGGVDGDSYVSFTETFGFLTTNPTTTTIYPTDTASSVATAAVDREAWTARGAGVQTDVTNTAAGYTAPIQVTDTAGGTVVDWWTKPLQAFTLAAPVLVNLRALESTTAANVCFRCEIAVTAGDGTAAAVWGATTHRAETTSVEAVRQFYVAGDDVSITDGQRMRIRFYIDDVGSVAMGASLTTTFFYAGTSAAASGDTYLTFGQALAEYVLAAAGIPIVTVAPLTHA